MTGVLNNVDGNQNEVASKPLQLVSPTGVLEAKTRIITSITRLWSCQTGFRLRVQDTDGPPAFQTCQLPNLAPAVRPRVPITPDIHGRTLPKEFPLRIPFFDSTARFVERVRLFILLYTPQRQPEAHDISLTPYDIGAVVPSLPFGFYVGWGSGNSGESK